MTVYTAISVKIMQETEDRGKEAKKSLDTLKGELVWLLPQDAQLYLKQEPSYSHLDISTQYPRGGGGAQITDLLVSLVQEASAQGGIVVSIITALSFVVSKFLDREKESEVTIEANGKKFVVKGRQAINSEELIKSVFPEFASIPIDPAKTRIAEFEAYLRRDDPQATANLRSEDILTDYSTDI